MPKVFLGIDIGGTSHQAQLVNSLGKFSRGQTDQSL